MHVFLLRDSGGGFAILLGPTMADEGSGAFKLPDDLPAEVIEARKRQTRLNALTLAAVLLLGAILPAPYSSFTPCLFMIPLLFALLNRIRQARTEAETATDRSSPRPERKDAPVVEPYSITPKDPKDPRRYKPIG